jgi:hypothetical protein
MAISPYAAVSWTVCVRQRGVFSLVGKNVLSVERSSIAVFNVRRSIGECTSGPVSQWGASNLPACCRSLEEFGMYLLDVCYFCFDVESAWNVPVSTLSLH